MTSRKTHPVLVRLPQSLSQRLTRQAERDGVSRSSHMVRLLGEASARWEAETMTTHTTTETRTAEQWWTWHDADAERWSSDDGDAEARCAAWVDGESDDGPEAQDVTVSRITVGTATETTTGVDGGVDVDVTVTLSDGAELSGEVTLVPDRAAPGEWRPYGDEPSMWVESSLLVGLGRCDDLTAALSAIESAANEEARMRPTP